MGRLGEMTRRAGPRGALLCLALAWLASSVALADEPEGSVEGFAEVRAQVSTGVDGNPLLMVERLRPTFEASLSDRVALSSTIELNLSQGRRTQTELQALIEDSALGPVLEAAQCTWPTEDNEVLWTSQASDYLYVDRLYLDVYTPQADVRVGRQALQWGSGLMVNPTDPFPQVLLLTPWLPRAGVNSVRASVPLGEAHQLQAVVGADDDFRALRAAGRGTLNLWETDFSLIGAWRQQAADSSANDSAIVGLDIKGTLGVGFWLEGALHLDVGQDPAEPYEELAVGLDYSFPVLQMLVVQAQYYRNGAGSPDFDPSASTGGISDAVALPTCTGLDLAEALGGGEASEPDPFAPRFSGRDYLISAVSLGLTQDLSVSGAWVQNLGDGSGMVVPTVGFLPNGWLELGGAAQLPLSLTGESGELRPSEEDLVLADPSGTFELDFSGLVPNATFLLWTRASF